eukprot:4527050-Alexandrium_andersonii.AAC.1
MHLLKTKERVSLQAAPGGPSTCFNQRLEGSPRSDLPSLPWSPRRNWQLGPQEPVVPCIRWNIVPRGRRPGSRD